MKISNLRKQMDDRIIINQIDFELYDNEIVGLIGRNGSGKTTLFRTIAGDYLPEAGDIAIDGVSIYQDVSKKGQIFYIDELDNFLKTYNLKKINAFYRAAYPTFNQDLYLQLMQENQLPDHLAYRRMSKGMQGLYQMILAIASGARYLLLDEPFDGLDVIIRKQVIGMLLEHIAGDGGRCALIASHNLKELEDIIDRALLLKGKTIVRDYRLESMRENARKLQLVFKTKKVPDIVKENSKLLTIQGRVITAVFERFTPDLAQALRAQEPLLMEELPLSLEDLFEANLSKESFIQ